VYRPDSTFCLADAVAAPLQTLRHVITALVSSIYIDPFFLDAASLPAHGTSAELNDMPRSIHAQI
jgi:hypothetical protein